MAFLDANRLCFMVRSSFVSYRALWFGGAFFIIALLLYLSRFGDFRFWNYLSSDREHWGQFGDFLGGLLNPIIGLITIWLFTKSLHQNSEMLKAAKQELKLAREEIARGIQVQAATEVALRKQIEIAQAERDFNVILGLKNKYDQEISDSNFDQSFYGQEIARREQFLSRYIDSEFSSVITKAFNTGFDPFDDFAVKTLEICSIRFKFSAMVELGYVRIEQIDVPSGSVGWSFFWVGKVRSVKPIKNYLARVKSLHESARIMLEHYLKVPVGDRPVDFSGFDGLCHTLPLEIFLPSIDDQTGL